MQTQIRPCRGDFFLKINKRAGQIPIHMQENKRAGGFFFQKQKNAAICNEIPYCPLLMSVLQGIILQAEEMSYLSVRKSRKYEENVTSKRCGRATFTECVPLPPEARGLNAWTAGSHQTYNSWRARSCFEHTKQAKVGGQSAGPKACLALLAERKQQRMLSRRRERPPFQRLSLIHI